METKKFSKLNSYNGFLTPEKAAKGIAAARKNAQSLLRDAELLFQHDRWSRSVSLSVLSIEEAGKISLIRVLLLIEDGKELKDAWRAYRSHTEKNVMWVFPGYAMKRKPHNLKDYTIEDFRPVVDPNSDHPQILDAIKQIGFYSDCFGKAHWVIPDEVIKKDFTLAGLENARLLVPNREDAMESAPELALWVKHMKPVWKEKKMTVMKRALIECYKEASALGVLRGNTNAEEMISFLG